MRDKRLWFVWMIMIIMNRPKSIALRNSGNWVSQSIGLDYDVNETYLRYQWQNGILHWMTVSSARQQRVQRDGLSRWDLYMQHKTQTINHNASSVCADRTPSHKGNLVISNWTKDVSLADPQTISANWRVIWRGCLNVQFTHHHLKVEFSQQ